MLLERDRNLLHSIAKMQGQKNERRGLNHVERFNALIFRSTLGLDLEGVC
jgi:hypothetical protein